MISASLTILGNKDLKSILDINFVTVQEIAAAGRKNDANGGKRASDGRGMIQLVFNSADGWGNDLGTGFTNGAEMSCKAIYGIVGCQTTIFFYIYLFHV